MLKSFLKNSSGNVAMMFALVMPVAAGAVGAAVDLTTAYNHNSKLQSATDAAVLAAAGLPMPATLAERQAIADSVLAANIAESGALLVTDTKTLTEVTGPGGTPAFTYTVDGHTVTSFASVFGVERVDQRTASTAAIASDGTMQGVEMAIAFDVTASMTFVADDGVSTSREQAYDAITGALTSMQQLSGESDFYVSFLPIADRINIGTDKADWMVFGDFEGEAEAAGASIIDDTNYRGTVTASNWNGCAHPRYLGDSADHEDVEATDLPYFLSDAPPSGEGGVPFRAMKDSHKAAHDSRYSLKCNGQELVGPTNDISQVSDALDGLRNAGTGRFDEAFAWSWRLLSPNWQDVWGPTGYPEDPESLDDGATPRRKIMLIFTDGHTTAYHREFDHNMIWGYNNSTPEQMQNITAICDAAKAQDIEIYIFHVLGNGERDVVDTFQSCVSDRDAYAQSVDTYYHQVSTFSDLTAGLASLQVANTAPRLVK